MLCKVMSPGHNIQFTDMKQNFKINIIKQRQNFMVNNDM
jgi:hypothetical protein